MTALAKVALRAVVILAVAVGTGCALVIDLGDEAQLRVDAGPPVVDVRETSTPEVDTGAPDTGPVYACGLEGSTNPSCGPCIEAQCCDVSKRCHADPDCVAGLECIKDCFVQLGCVNGCLARDNPNLSELTLCTQFKCNQCTPPPDCVNLGRCAATLDPAEFGLIRNYIRGLLLDADADACRRQHLEMPKYSSHSDCAGPTPQ